MQQKRSTLSKEHKLIESLKIDRDLLVTYSMDKARSWYETASREVFAGYGAAVNPTYVTVNRSG